jgi:hypothetical protein
MYRNNISMDTLYSKGSLDFNSYGISGGPRFDLVVFNFLADHWGAP